MEVKLSMITVLTDNVDALSQFYRDVIGFKVKSDMGEFVEFENEGIRFSICSRSFMASLTEHAAYSEGKSGQAFELAFSFDNSQAVDDAYDYLISNGAISIQAPSIMPWGQRTAFFADPEGNVHELFTDIHA